MPKISAFCTTTNPTMFGYPFIESIRSWLPVVDELVVIDGGSTDGTVEMIKAIGDNKIRIVQDEDTKWEDDWAYWRMGHNFNRGYHECVGDIVVKFDVDYVLHHDAYRHQDERQNFRKNCEEAVRQNALIIGFIRWNFVMTDRYFFKKRKTLAVNRVACRKRNIPVDYGLDMHRWRWGFEPIVKNKEENSLLFGDLLGVDSNSFVTNVKVFNYGSCFSTKEQLRWSRDRHLKAETRQQNMRYTCIPQPVPTYTTERLNTLPEAGLNEHIKHCMDYIRNKNQVEIPIEQHPDVMQKKLLEVTPEIQGYNFWGMLPKSKYYE